MFGSVKLVYYICTTNQLNLSIMSPEQRAKDFATWLIIYTREVNTMGACRIYKNKTLNVEELYQAWEEFKQRTNNKF